MRSAVQKFRAALDRIVWVDMPDGFKDFPRGACGGTSDILAEYLYSLGVKNIDYVCGEIEGQSHAWLEYDGIAADITADQFPDITDSVLFQSPSVWHSKFTEVERRKAGYIGDSGPAVIGMRYVHKKSIKGVGCITKQGNLTSYSPLVFMRVNTRIKTSSVSSAVACGVIAQKRNRVLFFHGFPLQVGCRRQNLVLFSTKSRSSWAALFGNGMAINTAVPFLAQCNSNITA